MAKSNFRSKNNFLVKTLGLTLLLVSLFTVTLIVRNKTNLVNKAATDCKQFPDSWYCKSALGCEWKNTAPCINYSASNCPSSGCKLLSDIKSCEGLTRASCEAKKATPGSGSLGCTANVQDNLCLGKTKAADKYCSQYKEGSGYNINKCLADNNCRWGDKYLGCYGVYSNSKKCVSTDTQNPNNPVPGVGSVCTNCAVICTPGQETCDGGNIKRCSSNGCSAPATSCPSGKTCKPADAYNPLGCR